MHQKAQRDNILSTYFKSLSDNILFDRTVDSRWNCLPSSVPLWEIFVQICNSNIITNKQLLG